MSDPTDTDTDTTEETIQIKRLIPDTSNRGVLRNTFGYTADELLFIALPPLALGFGGGHFGLFSPGDHLVELLGVGMALALAVNQAPYHLTPYSFTAKWFRYARARLRMPLVSTAARDVPGIVDCYDIDDPKVDGAVGVGETKDDRLFAVVLADPEGADNTETANSTYLDREEWVTRAAAFADEFDAALAKVDIDAQLSYRVRPTEEAGGDGAPAVDTQALADLLQDHDDDTPDDARAYAAEAINHAAEHVRETEVMHRRLAVVVDVRGGSGTKGSLRSAIPFLQRPEDERSQQHAALADRVAKAERVATAVGGSAMVLDADGLGDTLRDYWLGDGTGGINVSDQVATEDSRQIQGNADVREARDDQDSAPTPAERVAEVRTRLLDAARDVASHVGGSRRTALWGPATFDEQRKHVEVGEFYTSSLWISSWPTAPDVGLLSEVASTPGVAFDLALHVGAPDRRKKVDEIDDEMSTLSTAGWRQSQQGEDGRAGDAERQHGEKRELRDYAQEKDAEIAEVSATITVRSPDEEAVADARETIRERCRGIGVTATPAHGDHRAALTSTAPMADDKLNRVLRSGLGELLGRWLKVSVQLGVDTRADMPTDTLGCIVPPLHAVRQDKDGALYGLAQARHPTGSTLSPAGFLQVDRRALRAPHRYVIGASGAGKTYWETAQLFAELLRGTLSRVVIIDIAENFQGLVEAFDGSRVDPEDTLLNPFAISPGAGAGLSEKVNLVADLLLIFLMNNASESRALELRPIIKKTVARTYDRVGITADPETHGDPSPVFADWIDTLEAVEEDSSEVSLRDTKGEQRNFGKDAGWLLTRFTSFPDEYGFLCPDPEAGDDPEGDVDVDDRVVLFDFSEYQDKDDEAKGMLATHILSHAFRTAKRSDPGDLVGVCVDEAHDVFKDSQRAGRFEKTVRAGRNHGLAFDFLSQAAGDFSADEAEVIAEQCPVTVAGTLGADAKEAELRKIGFNREQAHAIAGGLEPGQSDAPFSELMITVEGDTYRTAVTTSPVMGAMIGYRESDDGDWRKHVDRALLGGEEGPESESDPDASADSLSPATAETDGGEEVGR